MTIDIAEATSVWTATSNRIVLIDADQPTDAEIPLQVRQLHITRLGGWNNPTQADDDGYLGTGGIDPYDVDTWIARSDVIVTDRAEVVVADRATDVIDLTVDPATELSAPVCPAHHQPCFWAGSISLRPSTQAARAVDPFVFSNTVNRWWIVTIDGHDPLLIQAIAPPDDTTWLDLIETITIANLELGPDAPPLPAG